MPSSPHALPLTAVLIIISNLVMAQSTLYEGFEDWPPLNWELHELGAGNGFIQDWQGISYAGSHSAYAAINNGTCDHWMVTPPITVSSAGFELSFFEQHSSTEFYVGHGVWISTGSADPASGDFEQLATWADLPSDWVERTVSLDAYEGQTIHLAWRFQGTWHTWFVDEVAVAPSNLVDVGCNSWSGVPGFQSDLEPLSLAVEVKNWGTEVLNEVTVDWTINGEAQTAWSGLELNWAPGSVHQVVLGMWEPTSTGFFELTAEVGTPGDFDAANNLATHFLDISSAKSLEVLVLDPRGMQPELSSQSAQIEVQNSGMTVIDTVQVEWTVDGVVQPVFMLESANLQPGESARWTIGELNLSEGMHDLHAVVHALGDANWPEDALHTQVAVNVFFEGFEEHEGVPDGWQMAFGIREGINFDTPYEGDWYYTSMPDANYFGEVTDTLWTSPLEVSAGDEFSFYMKRNAFLPTLNHVIRKDYATGAITVVGYLTTTPDAWTEIVLPLDAATGICHLGIVSAVEGFPGSTRFDEFHSTAKPFWPERDLEIVDEEPEFMVPSGQPWQPGCTLRNRGLTAVAADEYVVELEAREWGSAAWTVLESFAGVPLAPWEQVELPVTHNWATLGPRDVRFRVAFDEDDEPEDNLSAFYRIHVVPETSELTGSSGPTYPGLMAPFNSMGNTNTLGEDDITQSVYSPEEIGGAGIIHGIAWNYGDWLWAPGPRELPIEVAWAAVEPGALDNGWISPDVFEVLAIDTVAVWPGNDRWMYVPFDEPLNYSGGEDLAFRVYQSNPPWPPAILRFNTHSGDVNEGIRTRFMLDVFNLDPEEEFTFTGESFDYPQVAFINQVAQLFGAINGLVLDSETSAPVAAATVALNGSILTEETDAEGNFTWAEMPVGTAAFTVSKAGYATQNIQIDIVEGAQDVVVELVPLPLIDLFGTVVGNDAPTEGLADVSVTLSNAAVTFESSSDAEGSFGISPVYGASTYSMTLERFGYETVVLEDLAFENSNVELDTVVMNQSLLSPFDAWAGDLADGAWGLRWKNPWVGRETFRQVDLDVIDLSYTNEPFENVWLGNRFDLGADTTSIYAVEVRFDQYELAEDFVRIEVLDETGQARSWSEPFLALSDTTMRIPVARIPASGVVYAMVHWQDNAESTNALAVNFSDESTNAAAIAYPDESPQLLSDFFGDGPEMAFHVRLVTWDDVPDELPMEGLEFQVVRLLEADFPDADSGSEVGDWTSNNEQLDDGVADLIPGEVYRYAVQAAYAAGGSPWMFSDAWIHAPTDVTTLRPPSLDAGWSAYPNPVNAGEWIRLQGTRLPSMLGVYDAAGKLIARFNSEAGGCSTSGWTTGWYVIAGRVGDAWGSVPIWVR